MTANTLYEAVEPQIMWKQLLVPIFAEITGDGTQFEVIVILCSSHSEVNRALLGYPNGFVCAENISSG